MNHLKSYTFAVALAAATLFAGLAYAAGAGTTGAGIVGIGSAMVVSASGIDKRVNLTTIQAIHESPASPADVTTFQFSRSLSAPQIP